MTDDELRELMEATRTGDPVGRPVLSPRQRRVVELRGEDVPFPAIGALLGITGASARKHYERAVENLRLELERRENAKTAP